MKYLVIAFLSMTIALRAEVDHEDLGKRFEKALHTGKVSELMTCWIGEKQVEELLRKSLRDAKKIPEDQIDQAVEKRLKEIRLQKKEVEKTVKTLLAVLDKNKIRVKELVFAETSGKIYGEGRSRMEIVKLHFTFRKDYHLVVCVESPVPYNGKWYFFGFPDTCWEVHRLKTTDEDTFWDEQHFKNLKLDDSVARIRGRDFKVFDILGKQFLDRLKTGDVDEILKCWMSENEIKAHWNRSNLSAELKQSAIQQGVERIKTERPKLKKQLSSILKTLKKKKVDPKKLTLHEVAANVHRLDGTVFAQFPRIKLRYGKKVIITFQYLEDFRFADGKWRFSGGARFDRELKVTGSSKISSIKIPQ